MPSHAHRIARILAREVLDSRGNPTVEAEVHLLGGITGRALVPSGASVGALEAVELRDGDARRYAGRGVRRALAAITDTIAPALCGCVVQDQADLDHRMIALDGTAQKAKLGANAMLAVSMAAIRTAARAESLPLYAYIAHLSARDGQFCLPVPMMNILNGGRHADNSVDIQEFMIMPLGFASFREALRCGAEIFHTLQKVLQEDGLSTAVGDEGGFAPDLAANSDALHAIAKAVERAGYRIGEDVGLALDVAASEFHESCGYNLAGEKRVCTPDEFVEYQEGLIDRYSICSIEDGMGESDWKGWQHLTKRLGRRVQLVGDDVFVTSGEILQRGIREGVGNAILVKPNQAGTMTETLETMTIAGKAGYATVISHRSGDTEDTLIADLAVGTGAGQIKTGSLSRSERTAKYNRLLRIEEALDGRAFYPGRRVLDGSWREGPC